MKHMFEPIQIGNLTVQNRFIVSPMVVNYCATDGQATETYIAYHEARAKGGWGLIITEDYAIDPAAKAFVGIAGLWDDGQIPGHAELTRRVHEHGAAIFAQIYHAGRQATRGVTGTDSVAPTAIPCPFTGQMPHALTIEEVEHIIEQFGDCALRAKKAGFDGVEVHGGHGYLIAQFMSSYSNKRFDKYGGNLYNRMRLPLAIIANIREKCGDDFPIQFRISADEYVPGGRTIEDTKAQLWMLDQAGIDSFDVSVGTDGSHHVMVAAPAAGHGWMTDHAAAVKRVVNKPVFTVGRINDPSSRSRSSRAARPTVSSWDGVRLLIRRCPTRRGKAASRTSSSARAACRGARRRVIAQLPVRCTMNPRTGRENEFAITPAPEKKKVFVAGGGPAGMEAAIVAAQRGHDVTLFEKGERLGGQFYLASVPPCKGEISSFLAWQRHTLEKHGREGRPEYAAHRRDRQGPEARRRDRGNGKRTGRHPDLRARPPVRDHRPGRARRQGLARREGGGHRRRHDRLRDRQPPGASRSEADHHRDAVRAGRRRTDGHQDASSSSRSRRRRSRSPAIPR